MPAVVTKLARLREVVNVVPAGTNSGLIVKFASDRWPAATWPGRGCVPRTGTGTASSSDWLILAMARRWGERCANGRLRTARTVVWAVMMPARGRTVRVAGGVQAPCEGE